MAQKEGGTYSKRTCPGGGGGGGRKRGMCLPPSLPKKKFF